MCRIVQIGQTDKMSDCHASEADGVGGWGAACEAGGYFLKGRSQSKPIKKHSQSKQFYFNLVYNPKTRAARLAAI
jgi:hypothetical protein